MKLEKILVYKGELMKTATLILLGLLFISGCGAMKGIEASINRDKMNSLEVGMSKDEVRKIMGKPYKREIYQSQET